MPIRFAIEPLNRDHDRSAFACGNDRIDAWFRQTAMQDVRRRYATCIAAVERATGRIAGFYSVSSNSVPLTGIPPELARKLPRYPSVPAVLIRWLARDRAFAGHGLGEVLVFDAIRTIATAPIGAQAVFAAAIDERAATFYAALGFTPLIGQPERLYLPIATALTLV